MPSPRASAQPPGLAGSVKGSVLLSRMAFVTSAQGTAALTRIVRRLSEEDARVLTGMLMPFAWYPFATNARLDQSIAIEFDIGDRIFTLLGEASARDNLNTGSQLQYIRDKNPHALLKHTSAIYKVYYDSGHRTYQRVDEGRAILQTHDSASFSLADCLTVVGWHQKAIEMCGGRSVRVVETQCRARGGGICEYICEWEPG